MFIKYGGTDRFIHDRAFEIENGTGYSTYIRLRLTLKKYLTHAELCSFTAAIESWQAGCEAENMKLISVNSYMFYSKPMFEIDFDVAYTSFEKALDSLFDALEKNGCATEIEKAYVGYCFAGFKA